MNCNTCEQCGEQFEPSRYHPNQRFCTPECRKSWEYVNTYSGQRYICRHCGETYTTKHKSRNKYCSRECAFEAKQASTRGIAPVFVSVCPVCGKHTQRAGQYCADACRKERERIKAREHAAQQHEPKRHKCKQCDAGFYPEYGSKRRVYCSEECAKRAERANAFRALNARARAKLREFYGNGWRAHYEPIRSVLVFKRDKWTCQICGCKVKRTKEYHPQQASVDHIVPLALGGIHRYENVQTACVMCNSVKGADAIELDAGQEAASVVRA